MLSLKPLSPQKREVESFYDVFEDFFNDSFPVMNRLRNDSFKVDVKENEREYVVEADLPGVERDQIKIEYHDGKLFICTSQITETKEENERYLHRERSVSSMQRGVYLKDVNAESIEASLKEGVLRVVAPKLEGREAKRYIEIK